MNPFFDLLVIGLVTVMVLVNLYFVKEPRESQSFRVRKRSEKAVKEFELQPLMTRPAVHSHVSVH